MEEEKNKEEYSVFLRQIEQQRNEDISLMKTVFITVLIVLAVGFIILFFAGNENKIKAIFGDDSHIAKIFDSIVKKRQESPKISSMFSSRKNILLLGVDSNGSNTDPWRGTRSDTIILMNIDGKTKSVNAVSIPRDSKVYLADGHGVQKINSAHALGGVRLTKKTIEETFGVRINKYIIVSDDAVKNVIDVLGGLPIYVEKDLNYDDFSGNLHIHLKKGEHVLTGKEAVGYLRFRHDGLGDIGRTQRQQWFLKSLLEKIQHPDVIAKLPEIVEIANNYIKTDLSGYELMQYALMMKNVDMEKIEVATLPGRPNKKGSTSFWILDPEKTQEVIDRMIYREHEKSELTDVKAGIVYAPEKEHEAMTMKKKLEEQGIEIVCERKSATSRALFIANSKDVSTKYFSELKESVPELRGKQFVYDANKFNCPKSDFIVTLTGNDK
ncbi:LCP family protein [bacterium]|nr:LCP family protein [bacterium]